MENTSLRIGDSRALQPFRMVYLLSLWEGVAESNIGHVGSDRNPPSCIFRAETIKVTSENDVFKGIDMMVRTIFASPREVMIHLA